MAPQSAQPECRHWCGGRIPDFCPHDAVRVLEALAIRLTANDDTLPLGRTTALAYILSYFILGSVWAAGAVLTPLTVIPVRSCRPIAVNRALRATGGER